MSLPKALVLLVVSLFAAITVASLFKGGRESGHEVIYDAPPTELPVTIDEPVEPNVEEAMPPALSSNDYDEPLPDADRVERLFTTGEEKLPFVKTLTYSSRVDWLKGRPAWVADYAKQFKTSRHFIARSLNRSPDYFSQNVANGDRFNVITDEKEVSFHLLVDLSRAKMWFYAIDEDTQERTLLKVYPVGIGRVNENKVSGSLTPLGKYSLGDRIAVYKPGVMGKFNGDRVEMMQVFGTRWIPFDREISGTTAPAKGYGIHGCPWSSDGKKLIEDRVVIGQPESDGCLRLLSEDVEELFSIVITRPTVVEIVKDFHDAELPGTEVNL